MAGLIRRAVALAKIQAAEGTGVTPSAKTDAILLSDLNFSVNGEQIERNFLRDSLSPLAHRMGRKLFEATFSFELKAGPALGARPEWSPLMRAAGMSETVTSAVVTSLVSGTYRWTASVAGGSGVFYVELTAGGNPSITNPQVVREDGTDMRRASGVLTTIQAGEFWYGDGDTLGFSTIYVKLSDGVDPDTKAAAYVQMVASATDIIWDFRDTGFEFATVDLYPDGLLLHCVDSVIDITSITWNGGSTAICQARLQSDYATPTDVALPAALYQTHLPPIAASMAFTVNSVATLVVPTWTVSFGTQIAERRDINSANGFKGLSYVGRNPTGSFTCEQELVATWPYYTRWENATELPWSASMGTAGSRLTFDGPSMQITNIQSADLNGRRAVNISYKLNGSASDREFTIKAD